MAAQLGHSKSLKYLLTKWFDEVKNTNEEFLKLLQRIIRETTTSILEPALELQRDFSKTVTSEMLQKKEVIIGEAKSLEPYFIELLEFTHSYRALIEELDGFGLAFNAKRKAIDFLVLEIAKQENFMLSLKNLIKALNVVFRKGSKPTKRNEAEFEHYLREFNRKTKVIDRDFDSTSQLLSSIIVELSNEVDKTKEEEDQTTT